ncbi:MAG: DUF4852 domain-containing protein [Bdellovibrionaceae bacterium]|nr:DUF4852 domain-containing protein [Pseudobdellovibrionaceae bacterium]
MKAQLSWLSIVLFCFTLQAFAQDEGETTTESTVSEEATTEETAAEPAEKTENWISCGTSYLQHVRQLPAAKQKAELENWWELSDREFGQIKRDEFQWKERQPQKLKEFQELLAAKPVTESILLKVKFGAYDFKQKGFPVDIATEKSDRALKSHYKSSGGFSMGGIGGPPEENLGACTMMISDFNKAQILPGTVKLRGTNVAKMKFIPVPEATAKELTSTLGSDRIVTVVLRYLPGKTELKRQKLGSNYFNTLYVDAQLQELEFGAGDGRVTAKF